MTATPKPRPLHHSVSSCSEYERCPRRFQYGYVQRLPQDRHVPEAWRVGTVVHRALEVAYQEVAAGTPLPDTRADALAAPLGRVVDRGAGLEHARVDADVGQVAVPVGHDLEGQAAEGCLVGGGAGRLDGSLTVPVPDGGFSGDGASKNSGCTACTTRSGPAQPWVLVALAGLGVVTRRRRR